MQVVKPKLVIAGPGAGKTHGMVDEIIKTLPNLESHRYMVVITYTNSATQNIKKRLSKRISIPPNLFIGTTHSFLNRFIVIPYASINNNEIKGEKLFIQCGTENVLEKLFKSQKKPDDIKAISAIRSKVKRALLKDGYITYDQTLVLAEECFSNKRIKEIIGYRIQYLFVDEFQDTNNKIFGIIEGLRKQKQTIIYCVGDPEQYIQSFDSSIKKFNNLPILKASRNSQYITTLNKSNRRSAQPIVDFLNNFSQRRYGDETFEQERVNSITGEGVKFINVSADITKMLPSFFSICEKHRISFEERGIIAKENHLVKKAIAALNGNYISPDKSINVSPINEIKDTLLAVLDTSQSLYCEKYKETPFELRVKCVKIVRAIRKGEITNENTFVKFITETLKLQAKNRIPFKIDNLRMSIEAQKRTDALMVSNIHRFKGLEVDAVLAVAKTENELNLWLETNVDVRDSHNDKNTSDYPRLGYVAFSRARKVLCISCIEPIGNKTKQKLSELNVEII
ncbi:MULTISPECIES: UvrD-helicase domain-containing protein [Flavobacteriaceae]|uniref:UvrD-helicase domain-containing protein n=1 Tax=Flavobacteriaceae TaxID=49546 RepID=UPI00234B287A|nr:UvrD-helicase domain-containing protein [Muricauda sp. SP22]MDC6361625.1 UvrD-helicase domain-containing protein [Muricauda sp. SP22]